MSRLIAPLLCGLLAMTVAAQGQSLQLFELFTDNAVLQREVEVPVWGWAEAGARVDVSFDGKKMSAKAGRDGRWEVSLSPHAAGGKYTLTVTSKKESLTRGNITFGDVWLCSGQSNMEWILNDIALPDTFWTAQATEAIRQYKVNREIAYEPQTRLPAAQWQLGGAEQLRQFTAVGFFFAHNIRQHHQVPIGLLNSSWGGSRIEPWISAEALGYKNATEATAEIRRRMTQQLENTRKQITERMGEVPTDQDLGQQQRWEAADYDDGAWPTTEVPGIWEGKGYADVDGIFWYRTSFELTPEEALQGLKLSLGPIDDQDQTYVNGQLVGSMNVWNEPRLYQVPADKLRPGRNTLAIRITDTGGGGGFGGNDQQLYLQTSAGKRSLAGNWRHRLGQIRLESSNNQVQTLLYNRMIHPLLKFPVKGVIWYQGESNAGGQDAFVYRERFRTLINDWRQRMNNPNMPFFWVQLANFMAPPRGANQESSWAVLRESQTDVLALPNTGEAVIIDIGEAGDIHPKNKWDVGYRLALPARALVYGEKDLNYRSPRYEKMRVEGNKVVVTFTDAGKGLQARDRYGYAKGFAVAGRDGVFHWAKAEITAPNEVTVWSEQVATPTAVRYAWADNPDDANLYSEEGLPVTPFRGSN